MARTSIGAHRDHSPKRLVLSLRSGVHQIRQDDPLACPQILDIKPPAPIPARQAGKSISSAVPIDNGATDRSVGDKTNDRAIRLDVAEDEILERQVSAYHGIGIQFQRWSGLQRSALKQLKSRSNEGEP